MTTSQSRKITLSYVLDFLDGLISRDFLGSSVLAMEPRIRLPLPRITLTCLLLLISLISGFAQQQTWTNREGKTMRAEMVYFDPVTKSVTFRKSSGATYRYPLEKLDRQSQDRITGRQSEPSLKPGNPYENNPVLEKFEELSLLAKIGCSLASYLLAIPLLLISFIIAAKLGTWDFGSGGGHSSMFFKLYWISFLANLPFMAVTIPNMHLLYSSQPPGWLTAVYYLQSFVQLIVLPIYFATILGEHYGVSFLRGIAIQILYLIVTFIAIVVPIMILLVFSIAIAGGQGNLSAVGG